MSNNNKVECIERYNTLAREWNREYDHLHKAYVICSDEFTDTVRDELRALVSTAPSERQKVRLTITVLSDYAKLYSHPTRDTMSSSEHAALVVHAGKNVLKNNSLLFGGL